MKDLEDFSSVTKYDNPEDWKHAHLSWQEWLEFVFKISYILLAFATYVSVLYMSPIQPLLVKVTLGLGVLVILIRLVHWKSYLQTPALILMVLMCGSFLLSTVMNRQYGMTDNLKWLIWMGIQFFGLYAIPMEREKSHVIFEFNLISLVVLIGSVIGAAVSVHMLGSSYSAFLTTSDGETMITGFVWDRLWGVYTDPNYGAIISVLGILIALRFVFKSKQMFVKLMGAMTIVINYAYVVFSDSRTATIALILGVAVFLIAVCSKKIKQKLWRNQWKRSCFENKVDGKKESDVVTISESGMKSEPDMQGGFEQRKALDISRIDSCKYGIQLLFAIVTTAVVIGGCYGAGHVLKEQNIERQTEVAKEKAEAAKKAEAKKNTETKPNSNKTQNKSQSQKQPTTVREQQLSEDASNGRLGLWKSAIEVWESSPIYGTGYSTFAKYAEENVPDTYAVNNGRGTYTSLHNAFFNALAYQGGLGAVIFVLMLLRIASYVLKSTFADASKGDLYPMSMLCCVGCVAVSMMFLLDGIYTNSVSAAVLWIFCGYLVNLAGHSKENATA